MNKLGKKLDFKFFENIARLLMQYNFETARDAEPTKAHRYGAVPVWDHYFITINSIKGQMIKDIEGFIPVDCYPNPDEKLPLNELGTIGNFRILIDDRIKGIKIESFPIEGGYIDE